MDLVDTHRHLSLEPLARDLEGVLKRARAAGMRNRLSSLGIMPGIFG